MSQRKLSLMRYSQLLGTGLLALGVASAAQADGRDETLGVSSPVAHVPPWAGKAFRQGVVSVANPYGAEAGAKILEKGGNAIDAAVRLVWMRGSLWARVSAMAGIEK